MSKRIAFLVTLAVSSLFMSSAFAQGACTGVAADNLLACAHSNVVGCRASNECAQDRARALTTQDVLNATAVRCCSLTGRRQRNCLKRAATELNRARRASPRTIRPFVAAARRSVLTLRTNGCSTGSLGAL